jgi:hypothetical protein
MEAILSGVTVVGPTPTAPAATPRLVDRFWLRVTLLAFAATALWCASLTPSQAIDLVTFAGVDGPLATVLEQLAALGPGAKAMVVFLSFVVALITLAALRSFSAVLMYLGVAIFAAVGLVVGGAIVGMTL